MDWKDAIEAVAEHAPAVATALGGPTAGGITAGAARMVTGLLGVENTPEGLAGALQDPAKLAELKRIDNDHRLELEKLRLEAEAAKAAEETARLAEINKTIRAETQSEDAFVRRWRPTFGYLVALAWLLQSGAIGWALVRDPSQAGSLAQAVTALTPMWSVALAILGINVHKRSQDKQVAAGQRPSGFMDAIKGIVRPNR
ncbi:3TM-type holin [Halomonas koreensis]|uniref:3TM-type holin n=1 Tax=Halomonas koreensis TaxID=245385 RepID=A0ABU1G4U7_9GAMM|nr:3TM-type holin [Halomonas koreensis]MDR5867936.1 3TM-type holin [Halomonas koreensis]